MVFVYISDFHIIRPQFEITQDHTLAWLLNAHVTSEQSTLRGTDNEFLSEIGQKIGLTNIPKPSNASESL